VGLLYFKHPLHRPPHQMEAYMAPDINALFAFIEEREAIRLRREAGSDPPWTTDPILRAWSFRNVCREDDRTTIWIATEWRDPHADDPDFFCDVGCAPR